MWIIPPPAMISFCTSLAGISCGETIFSAARAAATPAIPPPQTATSYCFSIESSGGYDMAL